MNFSDYKINKYFELCLNELNFINYEIDEEYINAFLKNSRVKIIYCASSQAKDNLVLNELRNMFSSYSFSHGPWIFKNGKNLLSYLRQGLLKLEKISHLIFDPAKLHLGEENCVDTILKSFFIPLLNENILCLPKIYILDSQVDELKVRCNELHSALKTLGIEDPELVLALSDYTLQTLQENAQTQEAIEFNEVRMRIVHTLSLLLKDIITDQVSHPYDSKSCFVVCNDHLKTKDSLTDSQNDPKVDNSKGTANVVLDFFKLSFMNKRNLQDQQYISKNLNDFLNTITESEEFQAKLKNIEDKICDVSKDSHTTFIDEYFDILSNNNSYPTSMSKITQITELLKRHLEEIDFSNQNKKNSASLLIDFMTRTSMAIYLYGQTFLDFFIFYKNTDQDQAHAFIDVVSCVESYFYEKASQSTEFILNEDEVSIISDISSLWRHLYKELFCKLKAKAPIFGSEKAILLRHCVQEQLAQNSQILILI